MTDEQIKQLAQLAVLTDEKLHVFARLLTIVLEREVTFGDDFDGRVNALLKSLHQLTDIDDSAALLRARIRRELGLG